MTSHLDTPRPQGGPAGALGHLLLDAAWRSASMLLLPMTRTARALDRPGPPWGEPDR